MSLPSELPVINLCAKGKVLVRVDMNVPLDKEKGVIHDEYRIEAHSSTIKYLVNAGVPTVVITHQGRPGDSEFVSLELHAKTLSKYLGFEVKFVDDVIGPKAREEIMKLRPGEVLMLDNVRFVSEEVIEGEPQKLANTYLVTRLRPLFDYFVLDAFATAHRSQPTIVGFPYAMPSCMGLVMEREIKALGKVLTSGSSKILIAGGAKVPETVKAIKALLKKKLVDKVLVGGMVAELFLGVEHSNEKLIEASKATPEVTNDAKEILSQWRKAIILPIDAITSDGAYAEPAKATMPIYDIGPATVDLYNMELSYADIAIMTGPMGLVENEKFAHGTKKVMESMITNAEFTVIGGGHTIMSARKFGLLDKISHVSTGGRAFIQFLADPYLPGIKALEESRRKFWV